MASQGDRQGGSSQGVTHLLKGLSCISQGSIMHHVKNLSHIKPSGCCGSRQGAVTHSQPLTPTLMLYSWPQVCGEEVANMQVHVHEAHCPTGPWTEIRRGIGSAVIVHR